MRVNRNVRFCGAASVWMWTVCVRGAFIWDTESSRWSLSATQHIKHHGKRLLSCLRSRSRLQMSSESGLSSSPSDVSDIQSRRADWYKASFGAHRTPPPAWKMCPELFSCPLMPLWPTRISSSTLILYFFSLMQCFLPSRGWPRPGQPFFFFFGGMYDNKFISAMQAYEWHRLTGLNSCTFMNSIWNNIAKAPVLDLFEVCFISVCRYIWQDWNMSVSGSPPLRRQCQCSQASKHKELKKKRF